MIKILGRKREKSKKKHMELKKPKEHKERSGQDKLDAAKSRLVKLNVKLESILEQLDPLEEKKLKLQGDLKYYEGRVEKLTIRLSGGEENG